MPSHLFSNAALRELRLKNRIVVSPMAQYSADAEGLATPWHDMHVGNLLISGAGLVIMEATAVEPRGRVSPACLGLWDDRHAQRLRQITAFRKAHHGAAIGIQLAHAGRKASVSVPWEGQETVARDAGGWTTVAPSAVEYPGRPLPHALTADDMARLLDDYRNAARRAHEADFDLIELHCAHGYLLHSFLSPLANTRGDAYGGTLENRMRFPLEVFRAIRQVWPASKPLGVRVSATDWVAGGWDVDDSIAFAAILKDEGCDYIAASSGGMLPTQDIPVGAGYQVPLAAAIREGADIPVMAVGLITAPGQAETIVRTGQADFVALGRAMTYNPRWVWHAATELRHALAVVPQYLRSHPSMSSMNALNAVVKNPGASGS